MRRVSTISALSTCGSARGRAYRPWWAQAREWPSFRSGLRDLIGETEFAEMRTHGPKIRDDVAELIAGLRGT